MNFLLESDEEDEDPLAAEVLADSAGETGTVTDENKALLEELKATIEKQLLDLTGEEKKIESISIAKLKEMQERLSSGYTSFLELNWGLSQNIAKQKLVVYGATYHTASRF